MAAITWRPSVMAMSPNCDYLAYSGSDGCLKIWEVATGVTKIEYTPSSHLSASLTCLSWNQCKYKGSPKRKKHKPATNIGDVVELNLISMGTSSGSILLYSVAKCELYTQMDGGHSAEINDIKWNTDSDSLYSCSSDHHIVQWSLSTGNIKHKWKADKTSIYSMSILNTTNLLAASCIIKWWDLTTMTVLKKFMGHTTEIFRLLLTTSGLEECKPYSDYFLSAAVGDRIINLWSLKADSDNRVISSFILSDEPLNFDISCSLEESQHIILAAVTKCGILHIYEHLNGRCKNQLNPKLTIQVISEGSAELDDKPKPIPIFDAHLRDLGQSVIIAYGNFIKPTFEKISLQGCKSELWLIRKETLTSTVTIENSISKIKQPRRPSDVKILVPGHVILSGPTGDKPKKRKQDIEISQQPLEEKLNALSIDKMQELNNINTAAMFENFVHLLVQGLQSKDSQLLNSVLQRSDENVIRNTIKKLPLSCISLLLDELYKMLHYQGQKNYSCLKWLRQVLVTHMSYLMTCQDIDTLLGPIYYMVEARTETFSDMSNLSGCLDHLFTQVDSESNKAMQNTTESLLAHEESSEEEMEITSHHSGSEDDIQGEEIV